MATGALEGLVGRNRERFAHLFGRPAAATASAPGRLNLIGEHTDYNSGLAMPGAINRWIVCSVAARDDDCVELFSDAFDDRARWRAGPRGSESEGAVVEKPGSGATTPHWSRLAHGASTAFATLAGTRTGFDAYIGGNLPAGAGLSSSAACALSLLNALRALSAPDVGDLDLVRAAQQAEHGDLGVATGLLDQYASQFGRAGALMLVDFAGPHHRYIPASLENWDWVLLDTGVRRELASSAYDERVAETRRGLEHIRRARSEIRGLREVEELDLDELGDELLRRRLRHFVRENQRVRAAAAALSRGDIVGLGKILRESHASLRDDYDVSCPELDALVNAAARATGCAGARMMGGGFGGCTINLVEGPSTEAFVESVSAEFLRRFGSAPGAGVYRLVGGAHVHVS